MSESNAEKSITVRWPKRFVDELKRAHKSANYARERSGLGPLPFVWWLQEVTRRGLDAPDGSP